MRIIAVFTDPRSICWSSGRRRAARTDELELYTSSVTTDTREDEETYVPIRLVE